MRRLSRIRTLVGVLAAGCATAFAGSAAAQAVDEVTVVGHHADPKLHDEASYKVSYADLDLRTQDGRDALNQRIKTTALYVCQKLGEAKEGHSACIDNAIKQASASARRAAQAAQASHVAWKAGPAWTPPPQ